MIGSTTVSVQDHLDPWLAELEAGITDITRQTAGQFDRPALPFFGGKDSVIVPELVKCAFTSADIPLELLHADAGYDFSEVIEFHDEVTAQSDIKSHVAGVRDWIDSGAPTECVDGTRNPLQTAPLVETIINRGYDVVLGGARRDEEKVHARERMFSVRDSFGGWDPRRQRPEL